VSQGKLLIVEDEQTVRDVFRALLEDAGFQVVEAESCEQAINLMDSSIDLALLDMALKKESGIDILKYIRHHFPTCPAIMISGHANKENVIDALHEGAAEYLEKPVDPPELVHTIKQWLSYRAMQHENVRLQDYKATVEALWEREAHFAGVLDITRDAIISVSQDQSIQIFNKGAERIFGYRADEVLGKPLDLLLPETAIKAHQKHVREFMTGEDVLRPMHGCREVQAHRKDGTLFTADATIAKLTTESGTTFTAMLHDLTELKQGEDKLRQMKELTDTALDAQMDTFFLFESATSRAIRWNRAFREITGYTDEEISGMPAPASYYSPEDLERATAFMQKAVNGEDESIELGLICKDGRKVPTEYRVSVISDDAGKPRYFVSIGRNITERKRVEEKLQLTQFASDNAPECITWIDEQARFCYVNEAACREHGYTKEELLAMSIPDVDPDFPADAWAAHWQELQQQGTLTFETRHKRKDGSIFPIEVSANFVRFGGKEYNIAYTRDITERKRSESALLESEARFRQLFERHSDVMLLIDHQSGTIVDANPSAAQFYGYPLKTLRGMNVSQLNTQPESEIHPQRQQAIAGEQGEFIFEHRLADGTVRSVEAHISVVNYSGKSLFFSIIHDITERKQTETELHIAATAFESQESLLITDADGVVLRVNNAFTECTGYTSEEIVGQTPRLLKSGRHDAAFYAAMWDSINRNGTWQGEIWDRRKNGEIYPKWLSISAVKGSDGVITHYVGSHIDITERKAAEDEIKNLALYDSLTNLPNRRFLLDRLKQALASSRRNNQEGALLFIDLDDFKTLNDTLGHNIGDLLLQQVAQRLLSCVRESDTVARLGGDEFVVLLEDLSNLPMEAAAQTEAVGEKILATLVKPYLLDEQECRSTPSIGAALFNSRALEMDELFKQADIAMYQAKKAGRNTMRFFDPEMQKEINARATLEDELHRALEEQQFQLHYQVQVDNWNRPLGAEALIRWLHPERGLVSPLQFIPMAEESGLILPIGQWVLDTACARIKAWEQDANTRNLVLAVNVSARQFHQDDFVTQVQETVQRHGIKPMRLKLELTESMLHENIEETIAKMNALHAIGVQFSLDDFGTGYSSLQYLKRLPLDQLKIDQSFVRDLATDQNDKAIVGTIIVMAHSMELDAIAEGVETEEQQQLLMSCGCTHYQGYLFGKPVPIEQFEAQLPQT